MNGISLKLVPECNFVTENKRGFFSLIPTFFGRTYQFAWTEK